MPVVSCRTYINNLTKDDRERKRLEDIHNEVFQKLIDSRLFKKYNGLYYIPQPGDGNYTKSKNFISELNKQYPTPVVGTAFTKPTAHEYVFVNVRNLLPSVRENIQGEAPQGRLFTQLASEETIPSKASLQTLRKLAEFFKRAGIDSQPLNQIVVNGEKLDANGIAFTMEGLIQYVEGKEETVIPEEGMHIAVEIIKQTNPVLYRQMFNKIGQYDLYDRVLLEYRENKLYQLEDGRPNIPKIKDEAIAKLLVEHVIKKNEGLNEKPENLAQTQTFWQRIVQWLQGLFKKPGFNPFEKATENILEGNIGTVKDLREGNVFLQTGNKQNDNYNRVLEASKSIQKLEDPNAPDIEDRSYYVLPNDGNRRVKKRVTDFVKGYYQRLFGNKEIAKSDFQKAIDDEKKDKGTKGHKDMENAFHVLVDENGYLRETPLDDNEYVSQIMPENRAAYETLRNNLKERLLSFGPGARFMSEVTLYDKKRDLAGTVDLLAFTPDGKTHILDWKFFEMNTDAYKDVPWFKTEAFKIQIAQYKRILIDSYGIGEGDFGNKTGAIPILTVYDRIKDKEGRFTIKLKGIKIGNVNVKLEDKPYLLPVQLPEQRTGNRNIDNMLTKLQAIEKSIKDRKVVTDEERANKRELLQNLYTAIRILQVQEKIEPTIEYTKTLNRQTRAFIDGYNTQNKEELGKQPYKVLSDLAELINDNSVALQQFTNIDTLLRGLFPEKSTQREELRDVADNARDLLAEMQDIQKDFREEVIEKKLGVAGLLLPEKVVGWFSGLWGTTSEIQIANAQALYKIIAQANEKADKELVEQDEELIELKKKYDVLATQKGWSTRNYFPLIKKKDKNELINEFDVEFYRTLQKRVQDNDVKWIKENIDVEATKALFAEKLEKEIARINDREYSPEEKNRLITKAKEDYDISKDGGFGWYNYRLLNKFPLREKWESKEFKELNQKGNEDAKALYDYIIRQNKAYTEIDYITKDKARIFLPFAPKSLIEAWAIGGDSRIRERVLRSVSINEGDIGYGQYDPLEGKIVNSIPRYFTEDPGVELSDDLFANLRAYNRMALKFKHLREIEGLVKDLNRMEKNKNALATTMFGRVRRKKGTEEVEPVSNEKNAQIIDEMTQALLYGKRFIDEADTPLGRLGDFAERLNKKIGFKILPEGLGSREFSFNKVLNGLNNAFQLQVLGLHPLSAMSNYLGGNLQADIQAGKWYTKQQFERNLFRIFSNKLIGEDRKLALKMLQFFEPMPNEYNKQMMRKLSIAKFSGNAIQDFLMAAMRKSDEAVSVNIFYSLLDNTIIQDGELINAREFVRNSKEFKDRYSLSPEEIKKAEADVEKKIEALIKEKGIMKLAKINAKGELEIPGITKDSPGVHKIRELVKMQVKDSLGNISEDEVRRINLLIWGKSFMVFKNWIPRLIDVRIGGIKYNSASEAYEWGRMRMVAEMLTTQTLTSIKTLVGSILPWGDHTLSKSSLSLMEKMYEKKKADYKRNTNRELNMTFDEFADLMRQNIKNQMRDVLFWIILTSAFFVVKANAPDKDEDPINKNYHKFMVRALDKFSDEIGFFFNPFSFQQILNGSVFPSMGVLTNMAYLIRAAGQDLYGITFGDEDVLKKAHLLKYLMKNIPGANSFSNLIPLFDADLAKDWGISISPQSRLK